MELRSSRSRSKTPLFLSQESFDKETIERGNIVEKTVVCTTRRTTTKINESATSSTDEVISSLNVKPQRKSARSERSLRKLYKTSDYSSEDGEDEVTSTKTISQNEKNQLIEDARAAANGSSEVSALDLYKKSGRYWEVYPKTDWTYSYHSKDRVEIAPGVVAMPNMSRKTIHSLNESSVDYSENVSHKNINTDSTYTSRYSTFNSEIQPKTLFNNNQEDLYRQKYTVSRWTRFKRTVTSVFTSIFTVFYFVYTVQTTCFSYLHRLVSKVMLWDTWLLWKTRSGDKSKKLLALCLLPLILFGGWWLLSSLGSVLYGTFYNTASSPSILVSSLQENTINDVNLNDDEYTVEPEPPKDTLSLPSIQSTPFIEEKIVKITEKIYLEPPKADEIAAGLTTDQLEAIASSIKSSINIDNQFNTEELVEKIMQSPSFQTIINNYNNFYSKTENTNENDDSLNLDLLNKQQAVIDNLQKEINNLKQEFLDAEKSRRDDLQNIILQLKNENAQNNAHITYQLRQCCRKPVINIESYVNRILTDLLNNADFLNNQKGFTDWLHTIFIAKQDLETHLGNLTSKLNSKFDSLVEDNTKRIMDDVASKIALEMNTQIRDRRETKTNVNEINLDSVSDEHIRNIVKSTLAIYDADKTGLVDYAMETMGGQIVTTRCTETYHFGKAVVSVLGIPLWYPVNSPRTVITPSINPGECWAFQNFPGFVVIKLSSKVKIEAFSMEHISKFLVPEGKIDSAAKEFEVYGLTSENDREPVKLGEYIYDYDGDALQFFAVQNDGLVFDLIELRVISNHGNPNYTCLYRFRVHGKLHHEH